MKLNLDAIKKSNKMFYLVKETWQGLPSNTSYQEQYETLMRAKDSVEYIENAIERGDVVMGHKESSMASTFQLVSSANHEDLNHYIKGNEAHVRLPPSSREVLPLSDWDKGVKTLKAMHEKAKIRAKCEKEGKCQPSQKEIMEKIDKLDM